MLVGLIEGADGHVRHSVDIDAPKQSETLSDDDALGQAESARLQLDVLGGKGLTRKEEDVRCAACVLARRA